MSEVKQKFTPEPMQHFAGASLTNAYQQFKNTAGSATTLQHPSRVLILVNNTGQLVYISWDGTNDHVALASGSTVVLDESSNSVASCVLASAQSTAFYVKQPSNTAGTDNIYLSSFYAS